MFAMMQAMPRQIALAKRQRLRLDCLSCEFERTDLMRKWIVAGVVATIAAGSAFAESAAIKERKDLFSQMGKATGPVGAMLQGKAPFDLAPVQAALKVYSENSVKLKTLFPDDSKEGGKTEVLPAVWEKNAEFMAIFDKLKADSDAAMVSIKDEASFKAAMGGILGSCGTCHDNFRAKKS
jgi:cytochrome c556